MGNSIYNINNNSNMNGGSKEMEDKLDFIASHYILTMDFQNLKKLYEQKYCDELVVLTSEIIHKYFSDKEINKLFNRIEYGSNKEDLFYKKSDNNDPNITDNIFDTEKKKDICNYISRFYVKIAHLYSAILMTINPEYVYTDNNGNKIKKKFSEKNSIPSDAIIERVNTNLCDSRINTLKGDNSNIIESNNNDDIEIHPKICSMDIYARHSIQGGSMDSLEDMPGIPPLIQLYYDDDYDYENGNFKGMTKETQIQFKEDLNKFYTVFTGNTDMPNNVKDFSDIKLINYSKGKACSSTIEKAIKGSYKNKLFVDYASNLKQMISSVNEKQQKLLDIINQLFTFIPDLQNKTQKTIRINSDLTEEKLQELINETRTIIVELYLNCEKDFAEGVKLYEAIVESLILDTSQKQISTLQNEMVKLYTPYTSSKK